MSDENTNTLPPPTSSSPLPSNKPIYYYFGYGSNMCPSILAAKGVFVESSIPSTAAYLKDYELVFDLATKSIVEPSYANIRPTPGKCVHGVLHAFSHDNMERMDQLESGGRAYIREKVSTFRYDGEEVQSYAYVCYPNNLMGLKLVDTPPSRRYLNVLIHGAETFKLKPEYIESLKTHPYHDYPKLILTKEHIQKIEKRRWTMEELTSFSFPLTKEAEKRWEAISAEIAISTVNSPVAVNEGMSDANELVVDESKSGEVPTSSPKPPLAICSVKGVVLDCSNLVYLTDTYRKMLCGREMMIFYANRVATDLDAGSLAKTHEDLSEEQKKYVNATLMDMINQQPILGHTEERDKFDW